MSDVQFPPRKLVSPYIRKMAVADVMNAPEGYVCRIELPSKSRLQEEKYHAMIGDIAKCIPFMGKLIHRDDMKRLLVDSFAKVMRDAGTPLHHDGRVVPSLDGERVVQLGIQTKDFRVREASEFVEYLYSFGREHGVKWSEDVRQWEERLAA
jgi:hypothetical protein